MLNVLEQYSITMFIAWMKPRPIDARLIGHVSDVIIPHLTFAARLLACRSLGPAAYLVGFVFFYPHQKFSSVAIVVEIQTSFTGCKHIVTLHGAAEGSK